MSIDEILINFDTALKDRTKELENNIVQARKYLNTLQPKLKEIRLKLNNWDFDYDINVPDVEFTISMQKIAPVNYFSRLPQPRFGEKIVLNIKYDEVKNLYEVYKNKVCTASYEEVSLFDKLEYYIKIELNNLLNTLNLSNLKNSFPQTNF